MIYFRATLRNSLRISQHKEVSEFIMTAI